jgi:hypothetical protein
MCTGLRLIICKEKVKDEECGREYLTLEYAKRHLQSHHKKAGHAAEKASLEQRWTCCCCDQEDSNQQLHSLHMETHKEDKTTFTVDDQGDQETPQQSGTSTPALSTLNPQPGPSGASGSGASGSGGRSGGRSGGSSGGNKGGNKGGKGGKRKKSLTPQEELELELQIEAEELQRDLADREEEERQKKKRKVVRGAHTPAVDTDSESDEAPISVHGTESQDSVRSTRSQSSSSSKKKNKKKTTKKK